MTVLKQARLVGGRYRRVRLLGRGGMSEVWLAIDERLGREVAVKFVEASPESALDFERETGILPGLRHPNIVNVYDAGEDDGRRYLVMERVDGTSLRDKLRESGPRSPADAIRVGEAVSAALAYAHARGVLHNDVKPENILIDADGELRLTDFGAATITGATMDADGAAQVMGTIAYVAPEVLQGASPSPASDVYALGTTLFEALAGRLPYDGPSNAALAGQKVSQPPAQLAAVAGSVPSALADIIQGALASAPTDRPGTARLRAVFAAVTASDENVVPAPAGTAPTGHSTQRLWEAAPASSGGGGRRRFLVLGGVVAAGLVVAGALALSSGGEPREETAGDQAGVAATTPPEPTIAPPVAAEREDDGAGNENRRGNDERRGEEEKNGHGRDEENGNGGGEGDDEKKDDKDDKYE